MLKRAATRRGCRSFALPIAVLSLALGTRAGAQQISTVDIDRFWRVVDRARPESLQILLQSEYLDAASPGLRDYARNNIGGSLDLARDVFNGRSRYERVRTVTRRARDAEPAIRSMFGKLALLDPTAKFPDVYFVIGRFTTGGVTTPSGIVVAAELYDSPEKLPGIVAHELVHVQQSPARTDETLLARALREGGADFVGEMISGININPAAQAYGRAHEHALWREFRGAMHGTDYSPWMYLTRADGKPNDLGYFIGYRIAQAFYERASDKSAALRDLLVMRDADQMLRRSGYDP